MNKRRAWMIFFAILGLIFFAPTPTIASQEKPRVLLSPGGGWRGTDGNVEPGAINDVLVEKDLTLEVAQKAEEYLKRCPVEVRLTRDANDTKHTIDQLTPIVGQFNPHIAVAIHVNSDKTAPAGTRAWYTEQGFDDDASRRLAEMLTENTATFLGVSNLGIAPESESPQKSLYFHNWHSPSTSIEIGNIYADEKNLRDRQADYGKAIATAILQYLDFSPACADYATQKNMPVATYFPWEKKTNALRLLNDGLETWNKDLYMLKNEKNLFSANQIYHLPGDVMSGQMVEWDIPAAAPSTPGVYQQVWQLYKDKQKIGGTATVYVIVLPEGAREVKGQLDRQIEDMKLRSEQEMEKFATQLTATLTTWLSDQISHQTNQCLLSNSAFLGAAIALVRIRPFGKKTKK